MLYFYDETLNWAQARDEFHNKEDGIKHQDTNGTVLETGDNAVTLIKDLNVKEANFISKRGTAVRGISLVAD